VLHGERLINPKVLVVDDELHDHTGTGRAVRALVADLRQRDAIVIESASPAAAHAIIVSDPAIQCHLIDWCLCRRADLADGRHHVFYHRARAGGHQALPG
jgi:hypothetical protein